MKRWGLLLVLPVVMLSVGGPLLREWLGTSDEPAARVLVVDGWMPQEALSHAAALIAERNYEGVITTGAVRPCAYPLAHGETLIVRSTEELTPPIRVRISGLRGARWSLLCGSDTLEEGTIATERRTVIVDHRGCTELRLAARHGTITDAAIPVLYVLGVAALSGNVHRSGARVTIMSANGVDRPGSPTHADAAAQHLVSLGVPQAMVHALPTWPAGRGRTRRAAMDAVRLAHAEGMEALDVATLGVHAARTRHHYRREAGGTLEVRVIALADSRCPDNGWWRNGRCWLDLAKELTGWLLGDASDDTVANDHRE